jgi:protein SCO1/2
MPTRGATRRVLVTSLAAAIVVGGGLGLGLAALLSRGDPPSIAASNPVQPTTRTVPQQTAKIPLISSSGQTTDLAALRGRIVVLADFMTSCQEECPITTGALLSVDRALRAAHLLDKVTIVEVSVDPWRDAPSRLRAYSNTFGIPWTLLTGSQANLSKLWTWFGAYYARAKEGNPPDTNWQTGKPYTFDITHSDNVFVLDAAGNERALVEGNADVAGKLPKALARLLSDEGQHDLEHPGFGSWTPSDMLQAVGTVLGTRIPQPGS